MLNKGDIPRLLTSGLRTEFMKGAKTVTTFYQELTTEIPSTKSKEVYDWLGATPGLREWKDERQAKALLEHGFEVTNKDYEATISVNKNAMDDDQYGQIKIRVNGMGVAAKKGYDKFYVTTLEAGTTSLGYDGQYFFDTDHAEGISGSQSNYFTSKALTVGNAQTVISAMMQYKDDQGELVVVNPTHIMVPPALEWTARGIFEPQATNGDTIANNVLRGRLKVIVNPYLTLTTTWYVMDLSWPMKPIIFQNRKPLTFDTDEGHLFNHKEIKYGVDARFSFGYADWRYIARAVA